MDANLIETRKTRASTWFATLRDRIVAAFEELEDTLPASAPLADRAAGRFARTPWNRADHSGAPGGGGVMAVMQAACSRRSAFMSRRSSASSPRVPQGHSRRRRQSALLRHRRFADRAHTIRTCRRCT